ncbi:MAG: radical SAM protein, partial [Candidatus Omnitrophica bacterium]|nr:radical SAM protein [Candidatus Omnitrophota bacterium]
FYLNICGGEPFLRNDIFEIIKFANDAGIITDVTTNGSLLNKAKIKKLIDSYLSKIILSLEGVNRETHDKLRGKGQFDKIISAINLLRNEKINITLNTVINSYNLEELPNLVRFSCDNKLNGIKFVEVRTEFIDDQILREELWPNENKISCIINELIRLKNEGYPILNSMKNLMLIKEYFLGLTSNLKNIYCNLPYDQLCIAANGDVLPCFLANNFYVLKLGNLKSNKPEHLWRSEVYVESRRQRRYCNRNCMMGEGYLTNESLFSNVRRFYEAFIK